MRRLCSVNINSAIVNLTFDLKMAEENKENVCATSIFLLSNYLALVYNDKVLIYTHKHMMNQSVKSSTLLPALSEQSSISTHRFLVRCPEFG